MKLTPSQNHLVVQQIKGPTEISGIILSTNPDRERSQQFKVISVGERYNDITGQVVTTDLKAGDVVLVLKHAGTDFVDENIKDRSKSITYTIIEFDDVLATIEGSTDYSEANKVTATALAGVADLAGSNLHV